MTIESFKFELTSTIFTFFFKQDSTHTQGRRQKNFQVGPTENRPKNSKKDRKKALRNLFQGGRSNGKKTEK